MQSFILNFQRCEGAFHQCQAWVKLQLVLCLLLLTVLQLYHLSSPLPPPVSNSSGLFTWCQALYANHCTILHFFSRYCKIMSLLLFKMYYLCEKYYKPIEYSFPGSPGDATGKELICQCKKHRFSSWSGKWQPTPVFLPGNFHEQRGWWAAVHGTAEGQTWLSTHQHRTQRRTDCISWVSRLTLLVLQTN